ncbi:hypothetical protein Nepgr_009635 [Nepenthes gracilis]|uniref:Uncharacterized protein n=1 Tax=Nepenthes gracilis TaxID=150966 RepID=A0AAD3SBL9_NEPGR|nr:hypothetical protein Nepgr_009635 [Nepenthes gracilis]
MELKQCVPLEGDGETPAHHGLACSLEGMVLLSVLVARASRTRRPRATRVCDCSPPFTAKVIEVAPLWALLPLVLVRVASNRRLGPAVEGRLSVRVIRPILSTPKGSGVMPSSLGG